MNKQRLSKILAVLLCFLLIISIPACKSETVTHPSVVTTPGADTSTEVKPEDKETQETKPEQAEPEQEEPEQAEPEQAEPEQAEPEQEESEQKDPEQAETGEDKEADPKDPDAETAAKPDGEQADGEEGTEEKPAELPFADHPFAAEGFKPSASATATIPAGTLLQNPEELEGKTLTLYTAGDAPSFQYTNSEGIVVTEWDWMKEFAASQGLTLKLVRKTDATSLKAQRIALYAGQDLSLITLRKSELASGLTLCRSANSYLKKNADLQGISNAVLKQSGKKLFAPIGNVDTLWYNKKLMPESSDPYTLYQNNQWTTEMYTAVHIHAIEKNVLPMLMESALPWATLSGKSPLALRNNKLDSNLNAKNTQPVWEQLRTLSGQLTAFVPAENTAYSLKEKNVAMAYTAIPDADGNAYSYAPLPSFEGSAGNGVTFCGTFLALPKYRTDSSGDLAALAFAEQWCNRYSEALAAKLQALGIAGEEYRKYITLAEQGSLILYDKSIEALAADYFKGLTDSKVDMQAEYDKIRDRLLGTIAKYNLNY